MSTLRRNAARLLQTRRTLKKTQHSNSMSIAQLEYKKKCTERELSLNIRKKRSKKKNEAVVQEV